MSIPVCETVGRAKPRRRWLRMRLATLLGLVVVFAVVFSFWAQRREAGVPWQNNGGMIGWSQASIVARLGQPVKTLEYEMPDAEGQQLRATPPTGPYRTLVFQTFDGHFVAWFARSAGKSLCYRSTWLERGYYY